MISPSPIQTLTSRKRRGLGLSELEVLLDLFPEPTLLVDMRDGLINVANRNATELTTYTRAELMGMRVDSVLSTTDNSIPVLDFLIKLIGRARNWDMILIRRGGNKQEVQISPISLDPDSYLLLIKIEPVSMRQYLALEQERQANLWKGMQLLVDTALAADMGVALGQALEAGALISGATSLAVYQASSVKPVIKRTSAFGVLEQLPEQIPPFDLIALQQAELWIPGKRSLSSLHRYARTNNLSYIVSAPLGDNNASIGLLVLAGHQTIPPDNMLETSSVLASYINSLIQGFTLVSQLRKSLHDSHTQNLISSYIVNTVNDGVMILNPDLSIQSLNPAAESSLGYSSREVFGQPIQKILISGDDLLPGLVITQQEQIQCELGNIRLFRRSGLAFLASITIIPIKDEFGLQSIVILFKDLSETEQYRVRNEQLEQRALLGEVTASFAHEVRNPINNISTGLQLLTYNLPADDPNQSNIARMQQDCERLAELVRSSLSFARPMAYKLEPVNIASLLNNMLERMQSRMARNKVDYSIQIEECIPSVEGDLRALEQVFNNLVTNAIQAMPDGGNLLVKSRRQRDIDGREEVEVSISDTGPGIPAEIRDRIFEPFFTTKPNGTGLGLAIVKRIITAHKGSISVNSVPGGTVFQVHLPISTPT